MPGSSRLVELDRERVHRDRPDDATALALDEHLRPGHVPPEPVRVPDGHDADPRRPIGDEAAPVAGALARLELLHEREVRLPAQRRLEAVVGRIGAERRDPVERDAAADGVEAGLRDSAASAALFATWRVSEPSAGGGLLEARRSGAAVKAGSDSADARWLMSPTTSRAADGSSESPQRPMPVSSLRWTRTPSGIAPVRGDELEPRDSRLADLALRDGPHDEDARVPERGAEMERLGQRRDAERRRARLERGLRDVDRAVSVALRLDDGPQLGPAGGAQQRLGVPPDRARGRG